MDTAHVHGVPLPPSGEGRGEDFHGVVAFPAGSEGIHGEVLGINVVKELCCG